MAKKSPADARIAELVAELRETENRALLTEQILYRLSFTSAQYEPLPDETRLDGSRYIAHYRDPRIGEVVMGMTRGRVGVLVGYDNTRHYRREVIRLLGTTHEEVWENESFRPILKLPDQIAMTTDQLTLRSQLLWVANELDVVTGRRYSRLEFPIGTDYAVYTVRQRYTEKVATLRIEKWRRFLRNKTGRPLKRYLLDAGLATLPFPD